MSQAYEELKKLLEHQNALKEQIYRQCKLLVDMVLDGTITDAQEVNKILETVTYLCDGNAILSWTVSCAVISLLTIHSLEALIPICFAQDMSKEFTVWIIMRLYSY